MGKPIICTELPGIIEEFGTQNGIAYVNHAQDVIRKALDIDYIELRRQSLSYAQNRDWGVITDKFEKLLINAVIEMRVDNAT
jgi:glycosyltransferase involved in cell wall biosynthesis